MPKLKKPASAGPGGTLDLMYAKDIQVLAHIQRTPPDSRLRSMATNWDPAKEGVIMVAEITDGVFVGVHHAYDGGTRVMAQQKYGDPDYVFECWVKKMTEKEAAEAMLAHNLLSRRPSAYSQYMVALQAGQEWAVVIDSALMSHGLVVAEAPTSTKVAAVVACHRIVDKFLPDSAAAEAHFNDVLDVTMAAYPGSPDAYNADLLQAVSRILLDHAMIVDRSRLVAIISAKSVGRWVAAATAAMHGMAVTSGGSESRANTLRYELIQTYNKRLAVARKLVSV